MTAQKDFFIGECDFRVWLPRVEFIEKSDNSNPKSRRIHGIMSTQRRDRQGEIVISKGLDFEDFLRHGHFNDNHCQDTGAVVGYPTAVQYHQSLKEYGIDAPGWSCEGYVLKGTRRSDSIWELAQALREIPDKKLGFSIEGKIIRRADKTIEMAKMKNVAITNCPVNTDCSWDVLVKSFYEPETAMKSMTAGYGVSPGSQSGGGAIRAESLESDAKDANEKEEKKKKRMNALVRAIGLSDMVKAMDLVLERRPDFDEDAAAIFVNHLFRKEGKL